MPPVRNYMEVRPEAALDTECYRDYWSIGFMNLETNKKIIIEQYDGLVLDRVRIRDILKKFRVYTFNGNNYDELMIALAMSGASNAQLKEASDRIIVGKMRAWKFFDHYGLPAMPAFFDHIDIMEVAPGVRLSQKKYGARMNMKRLQELPIDPAENVGVGRRPLMRQYLGNDLDTLAEMVRGLREEIMLRQEISQEYGIDVRSNSEAQIAKKLIAAEVEKITQRPVPKPLVKTFSFKYTPPPFIEFKTQKMRDVLAVICAATFFVSAEDQNDSKNWGVVRLPESIKALKLRIGFTDYTLGIGGLHSKEKRRSYVADDETIIEDRDARAYYPRLMLKCGYVPEALGKNFLGVFTKFVEMRDVYKDKAAKLKKLGQAEESMKYKKRSDAFKIVNNGTFGNTGSPYAVVYAPKLMISTTITGQLSLLMLIEELTLNRFNVISANTDGIVTVIERERYGLFAAIVFDWEVATSFVTEAVRYLGVYSRDVNSYIAVVEDEKNPGKIATYKDKSGNLVKEVKRKGLFAKAGLQAKHDPTFDICSTAVVEFLTNNADIEETIMACEDITQFIGVKQVGKVTMGDGSIVYGGFKDGEYLGKMVRWYHGDGERGFIAKGNGARVAGTTGAVPCMDLPDEFPDDIDYRWYIREAYARLDDIGLGNIVNPKLGERCGFMHAHLPNQTTLHIVDHQTQVALCGKSPAKVRDPWQEMKVVAEGTRICKSCREERGYVDEEENQDAI